MIFFKFRIIYDNRDIYVPGKYTQTLCFILKPRGLKTATITGFFRSKMFFERN